MNAKIEFPLTRNVWNNLNTSRDLKTFLVTRINLFDSKARAAISRRDELLTNEEAFDRYFINRNKLFSQSTVASVSQLNTKPDYWVLLFDEERETVIQQTMSLLKDVPFAIACKIPRSKEPLAGNRYFAKYLCDFISGYIGDAHYVVTTMLDSDDCLSSHFYDELNKRICQLDMDSMAREPQILNPNNGITSDCNFTVQSQHHSNQFASIIESAEDFRQGSAKSIYYYRHPLLNQKGQVHQYAAEKPLWLHMHHESSWTQPKIERKFDNGLIANQEVFNAMFGVNFLEKRQALSDVVEGIEYLNQGAKKAALKKIQLGIKRNPSWLYLREVKARLLLQMLKLDELSVCLSEFDEIELDASSELQYISLLFKFCLEQSEVNVTAIDSFITANQRFRFKRIPPPVFDLVKASSFPEQFTASSPWLSLQSFYSLKNKNFEQGIQMLNNVVALKPNWPMLYQLKVEQFTKFNDLENAIETAELALSKFNYWPEMNARLAECYEQQSKPVKALMYYQTSLEQDSENDAIARKVALLAAANGDLSLSVRAANRLFAIKPRAVMNYYNVGVELLRNFDDKTGRLLVQQSLRMNPDLKSRPIDIPLQRLKKLCEVFPNWKWLAKHTSSVRAHSS